MPTGNRLKFALAGGVLERANPHLPGRPHQRLVDLVASEQATDVLEVCGGTGYAARLLAAHLHHAHIDSLDLSPEMIAIGRGRLVRDGVRNVTMHVGDAAALPFEGQSFDVVMSVFGLHELSNAVRLATLGEVSRVLRPGGRLVAVDLDQPPTARWASGAYLRFAEPTDAREVVGSGLADQLKGAGFAIEIHQPSSGWSQPYQALTARQAGA